MLPSWVAESPTIRRRARRSSSFVSKTLHESARFMEEAVFAERVARQPGFLQSLDARAKLISVLALVVGAAFLHHVPSLWLIGAFAVLAMAASRIGPRTLFNRAWWLVPGVFLVVAIPAVFNVVTPGEPIATLVRFDHALRLGPLHVPAVLTITRQGLASAGMLVTRMLTGVLLAMSLALTTRWHDLLKAVYTDLTAAFVLVFAMTYRYIFVLLRIVEEMHFARKARTITSTTIAADRRWIGNRIGALFVRSRRLSERVYDAMLARGFTGNPRTLTRFRFGAAEGVWLLSCAFIIVLALWCDRVLWVNLRW